MIILIIAVALVATYIYSTRNFRYWTIRKIKNEKPFPFIGTTGDVLFGKKNFTQMLADAYWKYPHEKVVGIYVNSTPALVVRDPQIVKRILVTDFKSFYSRGINKYLVEPVARNLVVADGDLWRLLRQRMIPTFSTGAIKTMFSLVVEQAARLQLRALAATHKHCTIDAEDLMIRFTADFVGAYGLGLDADSLNKEDFAFRNLGLKILKTPFEEIMIDALRSISPNIFKSLKLLGRVEKDTINLVKKVLSQRNYEPSDRNDFIDLLLKCKKKGVIVGKSIENHNADGSPEMVSVELDDILMIAQIFIFGAGAIFVPFVTSFMLHQLAFNPEVQKKVQVEIDEVLTKYDNKLSYDSIKELTYLESTFKEGLRISPSPGVLMRECVRSTYIPELNVTLDMGVKLYIPLHALHNDPQYFDNPDEFRPERFHPENSNEKCKEVYLPFGDGPRACIGRSLGSTLALAGLAAVLSRFTVRPAPDTKRYPELKPGSDIAQRFKGGLPLLFEDRTIVTVP